MDIGKNQLPLVSIIIVNFNGKRFLGDLFSSLLNLEYPKDKIEIIMVDNLSSDDSVYFVQAHFPMVKIIHNDENNYTRALNLGIQSSKGNFIGFLNNDMVVDKRWLIELINIITSDRRIGCVGGKILFTNGFINSTGIMALENYYFEDRGFNEKDEGQYEKVEEVEGISGGSILYARECLEDIGLVDEDFVMYFEDVDMAYRCKKNKWKIVYVPKSVVYHYFHGTSILSEGRKGDQIQKPNILTYFFCNRNRLIYLAKHLPFELPKSIWTSHFYLNKQYNFLLDVMPIVIKKLIRHNSSDVTNKVLPEVFNQLNDIFDSSQLQNLLTKIEIVLGLKKIRVGLYDHAMHLIGGGQKYGCKIASIIQNDFDVTLIANRKIAHQDFDQWYSLDLNSCHIKIIDLPFFHNRPIDPAMVNQETGNPFDVISQESERYDIFINNSMVEKVKPRSPISLFICHFPDKPKGDFFHAHEYSLVITNSQYTAEWLRKLWDMDSDLILYPPIDMSGEKIEKQNIILSVSRFEPGGSKKQLEMVKTFKKMCDHFDYIKKEWRFVLIGGSMGVNNPYLTKVQEELYGYDYPILIKINVTLEELKRFYAKAKIFWHACGFNETRPHWIEHFGMATVEAMQNFCVPVVFNGGGQREIVDHEINGFLWNDLEELEGYTLRLVNNEELLNQLKIKAYEKSKKFDVRVFEERVLKIFNIIKKEYLRDALSVNIERFIQLEQKIKK